MTKKFTRVTVFISTFLFAFLLDQITKHLALKYLAPGTTTKVIGNFFRLTLAKNTGGVFGTKIGGNFVYILFSVVGIALISIYFRQFYRKGSYVGIASVALLLSGAVGNLVDRIRFGAVTDFLDFGINSLRWATFNIADAAILIGLAGLLIQEIKVTNAKKIRDKSTGEHSEDED